MPHYVREFRDTCLYPGWYRDIVRGLTTDPATRRERRIAAAGLIALAAINQIIGG